MTRPPPVCQGRRNTLRVPSFRDLQEGAYVFITGRRQSELEKAKALIGNNAATVRGDVTSTADLDRLFETVRQVTD
jgi:NAD(P)-dependent dehydrogenase (short-subunit alcohol dehydrogenase family)